MDGVSTLAKRRQVVISQSIRTFLGLEPADKLFSTKQAKIIAQPIPSVDQAFGILNCQSQASKKDYKKGVFRQINKKFQDE